MNVLFTSYKGGVGKSSIAYNFRVYKGYCYITNDLVAIKDPGIYQIDANKYKIPELLCFEDNTVFDFGAMSTKTDPKLAHAVQLSDVIIIPTLTDMRSLNATVDTFNLVKQAGKPVGIIINNFKDQKKFERAKGFLIDQLGHLPIFAIRTTTLFERVARDGGAKWLQNIHHAKGEYQLRKTQLGHEVVFDAICQLGGDK